jgi:dipeptidyl aminopeptidase/acylaminoacyl peptidase
VPVDGSPRRLLYRAPRFSSQLDQPAWSPDGQTIAFLARARDGDEYATAVWIVRPDGSGVRQITKTDLSGDLFWSPQGRWLAFTEYRDKEAARIAVVPFGGDDFVFAGNGDDDVEPGRGSDRVFAGPGNAVIHARDGNLDRVDCGPGSDVAIVDRSDRLASCERRTR